MLRLETKVWTSKYLNNLAERDHIRVKQRIYPMLGFKNFGNAAVTICGIELVKKIRKVQCNIPKSTCSREAQTPQVWEAVLAA